MSEKEPGVRGRSVVEDQLFRQITRSVDASPAAVARVIADELGAPACSHQPVFDVVHPPKGVTDFW
ncbi:MULTISPECIES: hypothetical protein [Rhodococcus]|uniref:hypothetical protein n=1 Tax=Rhodococcus TaxID=1827 RepID=UPI000574372B|nr:MULTISPECIES: hypothetical protein [Rhodococcus]KHJ74581.1 hypothetical protein QR64_00720 [Rhodococcus sp. Chr-9]WKK14792.1 hypothetical protein QYN14_26480 [Rhodococcus ruber]